MQLRLSFFPAVFILFVTSFSLAQPRALTSADILRVATVSDAQISPNGEWVVYSVGTIEGDQSVSTLWLVRAGERLSANPPPSRQPETRRNWEFTRTPGRPFLPAVWIASNPRWSPDSRTIAFISTHDGQRGIWITTPNRPRPRLVATLRDTNFFISYAGAPLAWSPDSHMIAYVSASEEEDSAVDDPRVIDRIQYKSRTSFSDHLRTHVWITAVDAPQPRHLTSGSFYDHALSFSPRGDEIAFLSNHEADPDANNNSDIFAVDMSGRVRQLTQTQGCEYEPAWSPDGKWIPYTATKRDVTTIDSVAEDAHVWVTSASGNTRRELTASQDRRARNPRWRGDSRAVYFSANDHGQTLVFEVELDQGKVRPVIGAIDQTRSGRSNNESRGSLDSASPVSLDQGIQVTSFSVSSQFESGEIITGTTRIPFRFATIAAVVSEPKRN